MAQPPMGMVWSTSNIIALLLGAAFTLYLLWWIASYIIYIIRLVWSDRHPNAPYTQSKHPMDEREYEDNGYYNEEYDEEYDDVDDKYYDDAGYPVEYAVPPPPPQSQSGRGTIYHRSGRVAAYN